MGRNIFRRFAITSIIFSCVLVYAEAIRVSYDLDWSGPTIQLTLSSDIPEDAIIHPVTLSRLQTNMAQEFPKTVIGVLRDVLIVNSLYTFQEMLANKPYLIERIAEIPIDTSTFINSSTADLTQALVQNTISIVPLTSKLLENHNYQQPLPSVLEWYPAANNSTGIIIYAQDPLPIYGTIRQEYLQPALFPEIMDDDLRVIFGAQFMDIDLLYEQSLVAYTDRVEHAESLIARVGLNPIKVAAVGIYGKYPTDIILAKEDANSILASNTHTRLLTQGRIAVVLAPQTKLQEGVINE